MTPLTDDSDNDGVEPASINNQAYLLHIQYAKQPIFHGFNYMAPMAIRARDDAEAENIAMAIGDVLIDSMTTTQYKCRILRRFPDAFVTEVKKPA